MIGRVVDLSTNHDNVMGDTVFVSVPYLRHDPRIMDTAIEAEALVHRVPAHALIVVTLTHTTRWVTMQVEPMLPVLDEAQWWQDVAQRLLWDTLRGTPLGVCAVELTDLSPQLTIILREVLDVHRDDLALVLQGHYRTPVIRTEITHDVEPTYALITLRHD